MLIISRIRKLKKHIPIISYPPLSKKWLPSFFTLPPRFFNLKLIGEQEEPLPLAQKNGFFIKFL